MLLRLWPQDAGLSGREAVGRVQWAVAITRSRTLRMIGSWSWPRERLNWRGKNVWRRSGVLPRLSARRAKPRKRRQRARRRKSRVGRMSHPSRGGVPWARRISALTPSIGSISMRSIRVGQGRKRRKRIRMLKKRIDIAMGSPKILPTRSVIAIGRGRLR